MFSVSRRDQVRQGLLDRARQDDRLVAAAVTGSRAEGREDRWSDIDLYLGVRDGVAVDPVVADWSAFCHDRLGAVHHFVLRTGNAAYRAFLLDDGLQVDLGFTPAAGFGPVGDGAFAVVFGRAGPRRPTPPDVDFLMGMAWHHLLHARASIERGELWRAEHWISAARDVALSLASIRHGLAHTYARGADALPEAVTAPVHGTLLRELTPAEATRALTAVTDVVLRELSCTEREVAARLAAPLAALLADLRARP